MSVKADLFASEYGLIAHVLSDDAFLPQPLIFCSVTNHPCSSALPRPPVFVVHETLVDLVRIGRGRKHHAWACT